MKLTVPVKREFRFAVLAREDGKGHDIRRASEDEQIGPEECFTIAFRQATRSDVDQLAEWLNRRKYAPDQFEGMVLIEDLNDSTVRKWEIYLTICGTDLEYPDGVDKQGNEIYRKLEFVDEGPVRRIKNRNAFERWWGLMGDQWADEIYEACLEVNPRWDPKSLV